MISDERLREAAREAGEALLDSLPPKDRCGREFSTRFEQKMAPLLKRSRHSPLRRALTRAAGILLALLLTGGVWLGADAEAREVVTGWLRSAYETLFVYRFAGEADPETVKPEYEPGWIPEDWVEIDTLTDAAGSTFIYLDAKGRPAYFSYYTNPGSALAISTNAPVTTITFAGMTADFYHAEGLEESSGLVWTDPESGILFVISAYISQDELIKIAENIEVRK